MKRILITGGSGMLGSYVAAQAVSCGWETWATFSTHKVEIPGCRMLKADICNPDEISGTENDIRPDVIVHTAALVQPDICEQRKDVAYAVNVLGTTNTIAAAERVGAHLVHVSTDLVFNGSGSPHKEDAQICPPNYYGFTKAAAEAAVYACRTGWAIARTSVIYGPRNFAHLNSFSDKVISALSTGKPIGAYVDQYRPSIPAWNLADVLLEIADRRMTGIYHAVCPEPSTRFQFARKVAEVFGLDAELIQPLYMDETEALARRPKMLVIDTVATSRALNTRLLGFEEGIQELRNRQKLG